MRQSATIGYERTVREGGRTGTVGFECPVAVREAMTPVIEHVGCLLRLRRGSAGGGHAPRLDAKGGFVARFSGHTLCSSETTPTLARESADRASTP
ncbi:MAG: hypothetical protein Q8Q09_11270 [Deltaproteobacteria bacterium]|nr:hypothetical protein [Deltaproteobacteria bacterium]